MTELKRLAKKTDVIASVKVPISDEELTSRRKDYLLPLPTSKFRSQYRYLLVRPAELKVNGKFHDIQINHCTNPTCRWYGMSQQKFERASRYRLNGVGETQSIVCNPNPDDPGGVWSCASTTMSNWSAAEEIARLIQIQTVVPIKVEYDFHRDGCLESDKTPFDHPKHFYRRGQSTAKSQKWQCKTCKKITNVLPDQKYNHSYYQQQNDILPQFAMLVVNRVPVRRVCEILGISSSTYYHKLEWLYRKCLEFLARYEQKTLETKKIKRMWVNTDQMTYHLNNVKKRGRGGIKYEQTIEPVLPTDIIISSDMWSRYVLRADVAFDWNVSLDDVSEATNTYKDDRLDEFVRKYARVRKYTSAPVQPQTKDLLELTKYEEQEYKFNLRKKYVDGLHVKSSYTAYAHYWLMRELLKGVGEWRFVTDADSELMTGLFRAFKREFKTANAHHFLCRLDEKKTKAQKYREMRDAVEGLQAWGDANGLNPTSLTAIATHQLAYELTFHHLYEEVRVGGLVYRKATRQLIRHPLPKIDKGYQDVGCTTDLSAYSNEEIARMLMCVTNQSSDAFIQQLRRRISTLERPIQTSSPGGLSYIYANFNPKYAQYWVTIMRVYYNFCTPYKSRNGTRQTPAQRLELTEKVFDWKDIIYFR